MDDRVHEFRASLEWKGSTAEGYEAYDRAHRATTDPSTVALALGADPAFRGRPDQLNPEQLLVLAAASCQLLSFLAVAARARLDVVAYHDEAFGQMPHARHMRIERIVLRPHIVVRAGAGGPVDIDRVATLVEVAHRECFIAASLTSEVVVEPTIRVDGPSTSPDGPSA